MGNCVFKLKLPGGKEIILPAGFKTIEKSNKLEKLFGEYTNSQSEETLKDLTSEIRKIIPDQLKNDNSIKSWIAKSESIDQLIDITNNKIEQLGNYMNIDQAILNYLKGGKNKWNREKAEFNSKELLAKLKEPVNTKYFSNFGAQGVIGLSSINEEKNKIKKKDVENKEMGYSDAVTSNMPIFLNAITYAKEGSSYKSEDKTANTLYGTNNSFIGNAWVTEDGVVVYNMNDDLSLFLGLFKKEALKIDPLKLFPIIQEINKIVKAKKYGKVEIPLDEKGEVDSSAFGLEEFFNGTLKNGVINESIFESLLSKGKNKDIREQIDKILKLISDNINPDNQYLNLAIRKLFWSLSPDEYGKNRLSKELKEKAILDKYIESAQVFKDDNYVSSIDIPQDEMERNKYYGRPIYFIENLYEEAKKNIAIGKDIIAFTSSSNKPIYGIVTNIYPKKDGVYIRGVRKNSLGEIETFKETFKDSLQLRKRENEIDPYVAGEKIIESDGILVTSDSPFSQDILKRYVRRGDTVAGILVTGVNPGNLVTITSKGVSGVKDYNKIKSFKSALIKEELELEGNFNPKGMTPVKGEELSEGDYFLFKGKGKNFYKRIVFADKENVWSFVESKNGEYILKSTPKQGLEGLKSSYGLLKAEEIQNIISESSKIGRSEATMSSFDDYKLAEEGDYVIIKNNSKYTYGKVLDNNKVFIYDLESKNKIVKDLSNLENATFLTNRDISSNFAFHSVSVNQNKIFIQDDIENDLQERAYYIVPEGTDISSIKEIAENLYNIGSFSNKIKPGYIDITEEILKRMGESHKKKVFFEKESSNTVRYIKNIIGLREMTNFNLIPLQYKLDLEILNPGVYFSVFTDSYIDFNIYRILSVDGNKIKAQVQKMNNGKIVTVEKTFDKLDLFAEKSGETNPVNKIAKLYILNGNDKMNSVINTIKEAEKAEGNDQLNHKASFILANKIKKKFVGLGVNVEFVKQEGNFESNQKARIFTDENGKTSIQVNENIGTEEDVLHEFLHLFLTPLRYKHPEIYNNLIKSVVEDEDLNVTQAEERFVEVVSNELVGEGNIDKIFTSLDSFVNGIKAVIEYNGEDYKILKTDNPIELLKTPLVDIFDINTKDNSNPLYNKAMVTTEAMMREWLDENNIILKCE